MSFAFGLTQEKRNLEPKERENLSQELNDIRVYSGGTCVLSVHGTVRAASTENNATIISAKVINTPYITERLS